ncbi:UDP-GlcNAc:undecaprenyl-phosphate GlcNAc-1-phosphate transferase [Candidatus Electrothrix marina]|uniref:UDP-GlcNAc:undecaprenyl-phosphate GlcNAc-1-phosphate transferase n=1 Tax=Candidatus Electrothrix marina TaxID=1859130 RepID=A0A444JG21_9BACT|nr:UDP-GlcNAc:undecaprenyl-phosphate GlcNAc-1-phosphate transferase [Candidatus Electrothrix marina]
MAAILFIFVAACLVSLVLTPAVRQLALHFDLTDKPSARKMQSRNIPRIGGIALFCSFFLPFLFLLVFFRQSLAAQELFADSGILCFVTGAVLIFLLGLLDDIRDLSFLFKIFGQLLIAIFVYSCGFQITTVTTPFGADFSIGFLSLPLTVFWFLLVINAINLIDGLDGLAAGICLFVSLSMLFVCIVNGRLTAAFAFAALAGALVGFLRYNFYPASIFMGDSGSYFLGYCLAALSIGGTIKGQVATAMLIPIIALGVPLMDTLWAPLRRFINGQSMFQPDNKHIHHRLVKLGFTHRRAVLTLYVLTVLLGISSMLLVHAQNDISALILFVLGFGLVGLLRYLSDSDLFNIHNIASWARDLTDETGISIQRRLFLQYQRRIVSASDPEILWEAVCVSLEMLKFDYAEFHFIEQQAAVARGRSRRRFSWTAEGEDKVSPDSRESFLRIELPIHNVLADKAGVRNFGTLLLMKDMRHAATEPYLLKRVEQLRRSMIACLEKLTEENS